MTNLCDVCGKPATQSMLRDLFGKSDAMRFVCSDHGFRMRDPADVAEIERLRAALAMVVKYGAAMGTAQWDVCRRALGNEQTGNEPCEQRQRTLQEDRIYSHRLWDRFLAIHAERTGVEKVRSFIGSAALYRESFDQAVLECSLVATSGAIPIAEDSVRQTAESSGPRGLHDIKGEPFSCKVLGCTEDHNK